MVHEGSQTGTTDSRTLDIIKRREIALRATEIVADVVGSEVSVDGLLEASKNKDLPHSKRLIAKRSVRFLDSVSGQGSALFAKVGEGGLYDAAEAMIMFGAKDTTIISLMDTHDMTPSQVTGLCALRQEIADSTTSTPSFSSVVLALENIGQSPAGVAYDLTDGIMADLDASGHFVDSNGGTRFRPDKVARRIQELQAAGVDPYLVERE